MDDPDPELRDKAVDDSSRRVLQGGPQTLPLALCYRFDENVFIGA